MAVHTNVPSFLSALNKYPATVAKSTAQGVEAAALAFKGSIGESLERASGGDSILSGVGRKGGKVGVSYSMSKAGTPTARIRATGAAHLIEKASKPHAIAGRRGRGRSKGLLVVGGQVITGPVRHPGTKAKRAWSHGVDLGRVPARAAISATFKKTLGT